LSYPGYVGSAFGYGIGCGEIPSPQLGYHLSPKTQLLQQLLLCAPLRRFFTDAYDLFVIGVVKPMIAIVYYPALNGKVRRMPSEPDAEPELCRPPHMRCCILVATRALWFEWLTEFCSSSGPAAPQLHALRLLAAKPHGAYLCVCRVQLPLTTDLWVTGTALAGTLIGQVRNWAFTVSPLWTSTDVVIRLPHKLRAMSKSSAWSV